MCQVAGHILEVAHSALPPHGPRSYAMSVAVVASSESSWILKRSTDVPIGVGRGGVGRDNGALRAPERDVLTRSSTKF
jgi:hypothetical protein